MGSSLQHAVASRLQRRHLAAVPVSVIVGLVVLVVTGSLRRVQARSVSADAAAQLERKCGHIRHVLAERREQVLDGRRGRAFSREYLCRRYLTGHGDIDGHIVSGHGREGEKECNATRAEQSNKSPTRPSDPWNPRDVFPADTFSLAMIPVPPSRPSLGSFFRALLGGASNHTAALTPSRKASQKPYRKPSFLRLCLRAVRLSINFSPVLLTLWLAALSSLFRRRLWYPMIAGSLARSGPAFIKWGQWASTRQDMFPEAMCEHLSNLHANAPAHSWSFTRRSVENALGIPRGTIHHVFRSFDKRPIASGSIAQVHRADLLRHNNTVAIKVRHPNVSRLIDMDFRIMFVLADIADMFPALSWLRVRSTIEQFSHTMAAQAHLNVEAYHLEVLNHNFRRWNTVFFPRPIFASDDVIIETFERGRIVTSILDDYDEYADRLARRLKASRRRPPLTVEEPEDGNKARNEKRQIVNKGQELVPTNTTRKKIVLKAQDVIPLSLAQYIVTSGVGVYMKMLLIDNLMHADLHPGNIMLDIGDLGISQEDGKSKGNRSNRLSPVDFHKRIVLVDAGMVAQLDVQESCNFILLLASIGEGDGRAAAEALLRFGEGENNLSDAEMENLKKDMEDFFATSCHGYGTNVDVGDVLRGSLGLVRKYRIHFAPNYATLIVNALCVEGLAKRVCPQYNVLDGSRALLQPYGRMISKETRRTQGPPKVRKTLSGPTVGLLYLIKDWYEKSFFRKLERKSR